MQVVKIDEIEISGKGYVVIGVEIEGKVREIVRRMNSAEWAGIGMVLRFYGIVGRVMYTEEAGWVFNDGVNKIRLDRARYGMGAGAIYNQKGWYKIPDGVVLGLGTGGRLLWQTVDHRDGWGVSFVEKDRWNRYIGADSGSGGSDAGEDKTYIENLVKFGVIDLGEMILQAWRR